MKPILLYFDKKKPIDGKIIFICLLTEYKNYFDTCIKLKENYAISCLLILFIMLFTINNLLLLVCKLNYI